MFIRSLGPQSLHNGKVLSYLDKAVMVTRLVPIHSPMYHTIKEDKFLPMSYPLGNYAHSPGQHFGMIHCTCQVVRVESHKYPDLTSEPHACTTLAYMYMPAMYTHLHIATDIAVLQQVTYRCAWTSHSNVIVTRTEPVYL